MAKNRKIKLEKEEKMTRSSKKKPTIMVYVDRRTYSSLAVKYACYYAKKMGFAVQTLTVVGPADFQGLLSVVSKMEEEKRASAEERLKEITTEARKLTGVTPNIEIRSGNVSDEILTEISQNSNIIMLVFENSGATKEDDALLAKITPNMGNKISIPILIIPNDMNPKQLDKLI